MDTSRKNIRPTSKPRAAAVEAILQVANERAGNNIARIMRSYRRAAQPHRRILRRASINAALLQRGAGVGRRNKSRAFWRDAPQPNKLQC